jgi:hypothetical protein
LRRAIHEYRQNSFKDLTTEMKRMYHTSFEDILSIVTGLPQRFDSEKFSKKIKGEGKFSFDEVLNVLWYSGIIGIEAYVKNNKNEPTDYEGLFPEKNKKIDKNSINSEFTRWYYFEYNYQENPSQLLKRLSNLESIECSLVFHPKSFNQLPGTQATDWPIGI